MIARVAIVGAGSVGLLVGACLAQTGCEVTMVVRRPWPSEAIDLVRPDGGRARVAMTTATLARLPDSIDVVVLAVKQFDLPHVLDALAGRPTGPIVTIQNGVGAEEFVTTTRSGDPLVAASLTAAVEADPGREVRWLRRGGIGLAVVTGPATEVVGDLATRFTAAGLPARRFADWAAMKWSKLVANLVGNATSALLDLDPAAIYGDPATFEIERRQLREAVAVMAALRLVPVSIPGANVGLLLRGIALPPPIARPIIARVIGGARGGKAPSLRLHLRDGGTGPTEVRWLNGAVADHGARLGVATPVNALLAALVDEAAADPARAAWWRGRPDRLRAAVDAAVAAAETASPRPPGVG